MNHIHAGASRIFRFFLIAAACLASVCLGQKTPPQTLALEIKDGNLAGPGAEVIRGELKKAQFILWGEEHGFADSPIVLRAIAREARPLASAGVAARLRVPGLEARRSLPDRTQKSGSTYSGNVALSSE